MGTIEFGTLIDKARKLVELGLPMELKAGRV
jgi:hypothetical protein